MQLRNKRENQRFAEEPTVIFENRSSAPDEHLLVQLCEREA